MVAWAEVSCGMRELCGLRDSTPKELILKLLDDCHYDDGGFRFSQVLFSDNLTCDGKRKKDQPGEALAKYIRDNDLGSLIETRPIKNRNTSNIIKSWIWNVSNIRKVCKTVGWSQGRRFADGYEW